MNAITFSACKPTLNEGVLKAISSLGYSAMTPVQAETIPLFLTNKDVCVEAVTGSGKTIAYVVPILEILLRRKIPLKQCQVGAIVVAPTRELAIQIHKVFDHFVSFVPISKATLLVGGTDAQTSIEKFCSSQSHIIVGTPGRIEDLILNYNVFNAKELEVLVLDEADTLLDMGFEEFSIYQMFK